MARRMLLLAFALVLCLPLVHFAIDEWGPKPQIDFNGEEWKARKALMKRARVFVKSPPAIETLDLSRTPKGADPVDPNALVECRYVPKPVRATTAKFDCELPGGEVVKVKYGWTPEKSGEVAATRLLAALGFGADHVAMVPRLRCFGCPLFPFEMMEAAESFYAAWLLDLLTPEKHYRDFTWVAVEGKIAGRGIKVGPHEGWDWDELKDVEAARGGATRAELDALRLMAVFLSHWDNKATNQRLVCEERRDGSDSPLAPCETPLLVLQDVGATFGPGKVRHKQWTATPMWEGPSGCVTSLESMPYEGGRFEPAQISEEGRALLAGRLTKLSEEQIRALFVGAYFPDPEGGGVTGDVSSWVTTFQEKVRQIASRSCPALTD